MLFGRHLVVTCAIGALGCEPICPDTSARSAVPAIVTGHPSFWPPLSFDGPACAPDGPHFSIVLKGRRPGKPPMAMVDFEIVVQNPLPRVVWFTFGSSPTYTSSGVQEVYLEWARVWHLGDEIQALRLVPGATVVLPWHTMIVPSEKFAFTFASEIRLGGVPVATWFGKAGLATDGEPDGGFTGEFHSRRLVSPDHEMAKLELDVLCSDIRTLDTVPAEEGE